MDVSDKIIVTLSKTNKSLTISEISQQSGLDRHTVAKYLGILEVLGRVRKIEHGNAKKYFLITSVPVSGLIDISSDLIIIVNKGLQIQYINSAASHKLGLANQSIIGERIDLLKIDLFSSPEIIEGLKHYSSNKVFRTEIGQTEGAIYLVSILEISLDPGNNLIAITAEDISERKKRELEIIESEEKYRALFTASTDPVVLIDQETGSILEGNTAACSVYGYDCQELCLLHITDIDDEPEKARQLCLHPLPFISNRTHRRRDGSRFPVEISTAVLEIKGRTILIVAIKDISERILAEQSIDQIRRNFVTFFNTIDEMLFVLDESGTILEVNDAVIKKTRYARSDLIGTPVTRLHPPGRQEEATGILIDIIKGKSMFCPIPILTRDGTLIPVETSVSSGVWNGKSAYFGVSKDISPIYRSEEKFSKSFYRCSTPRAISTYEDGRFIEVNEAFLKTLGYGRDEVIGKTSAELGIFSSTQIREKIKQLTEDANPVATQEVLVYTNTGSVRNGLFSATRIQIGDDVHLLTSMVDITDLRTSEQEVRESEKKYRTLLETLNEGVWAIDKDAVTTYVNPKMEQILGYEPGEMNGRHLFSFMDETGISIAKEHLASRRNGISEKHEFEFLKKDGTRVYANLETVPIQDTQGQYQGAIAGITDISLYRLKEQLIRETEEKFRILFNSSPDAIFLINQESGGICDANCAASTLYGYEYAELLLLKNTDLSAEPDKTRQATRSPVYRVPLRYHIRKDRTIFPVEISASTILLRSSPYLLVTIRDISNRITSGDMLLISDNDMPGTDNILNTILDSIPDIIGIQRPDHTMVRYNQAGYDFLHCSPEDVNGHRCYELIGRSMQCENCASEKALVSGKMERSERYLPDSGRYLDCISTPVLNSNDDIILLIEQLRDITEIKQAQQSLSESNQKLRLLSGLTRHDITNQLNALQLLLDLAIEIQDPEKREEYLLATRQITRQIEILIGFTREYETIGAEACPWQEVQSLIQSAIAETFHTSVLIECTISPEIRIFGDPILRKVFSTLIENAIRHGETVTRISFTDQISGNDLVIQCQDDGTGIAAEEKELIFSHGYGKNTGLGLYLVREILSNTGMTIQETGDPGKGAIFEILVPDRRWKRVHEEQQ